MVAWHLSKCNLLRRLLSSSVIIAFLLSNFSTSFATPSRNFPNEPDIKRSLIGPGTISRHAESPGSIPIKAPFSFDVEAVQLPNELASIRDVHNGASGRAILYIQDLHGSVGAQKQLASILDRLLTEHGLELMLIEGGITDRDFSYIRHSVPQKIRLVRAEELLEDGVINGETFIDIARNYDLRFQGIEDAELYDKNMRVYLAVDSFKEEGLGLLTAMQTIAKRLRPRMYNKDLREFDAERHRYRDEKIKLLDYAEYIKDVSQAQNVNLAHYPNFALLCETITVEKEIDFERVESERGRLIGTLTESLSGEQLKKLFAYSLHYKQGTVSHKEFYDFIVSLCSQNRSVELADYPHLKAYITYVSLYDEIGPAALFTELAQLEEDLEQILAVTDDEKMLCSIRKHAELLRDFLELALVPQDWHYYTEHKSEFNPRAWAKFLNLHAANFKTSLRVPDDVSILADNLDTLEQFYQTAVERDQAFLRNSLATLERENKDAAILIAGGFHTEHFTELLKENDISYLVITPRLTGIEEGDAYHDSLRESFSSRIWAPQAEGAPLRDVRDADNVRDVNQIHAKFGFMSLGTAREYLRQWLPADRWQEVSGQYDAIVAELAEKEGLPDASVLTVCEVIDGRRYATARYGSGSQNIRIRLHQILDDEIIRKAFPHGKADARLVTDVAADHPLAELVESLAKKLEAADRKDAAAYLRTMLVEGRFKVLDARELIPQDGEVKDWAYPFAAHSGGRGVWLWDTLLEQGEYDERTILEELGAQLGIDLVVNHRLVALFEEADDKIVALRESEFRSVEDAASRVQLKVAARAETTPGPGQDRAMPPADESQVLDYFREFRVYKTHRYLFAFVEDELWDELHRVLGKLALEETLEDDETALLVRLYPIVNAHNSVIDVWMQLFRYGPQANIPDETLLEVIQDNRLIDLFARLETVEERLLGGQADTALLGRVRSFEDADHSDDQTREELKQARADTGGYSFMSLYGLPWGAAPKRRNTSRMAWRFTRMLLALARRLPPGSEGMNAIMRYVERVAAEGCPSARLRHEAQQIADQLPAATEVMLARERKETDDLSQSPDGDAETTAVVSPRRKTFSRLTFGRVIGLLEQWGVSAEIVGELRGILDALDKDLQAEGAPADAYALRVAEVIDGEKYAGAAYGEGDENVRVRIQQILDDTLIEHAHFEEGAPQPGMVTAVTPENATDNADAARIVQCIEGLIGKLREAGLAGAAAYLRTLLREGRFKILNAEALIPQEGAVSEWVFPFLAHSGGQGVWLWDVLVRDGEYDEAAILEELGAQLGIDLVVNHRLVELYDAALNKVAALQSSEFQSLNEKAGHAMSIRAASPRRARPWPTASTVEMRARLSDMRGDHNHHILHALVPADERQKVSMMLNGLVSRQRVPYTYGDRDFEWLYGVCEQHRELLDVWRRLDLGNGNVGMPPSSLMYVLENNAVIDLFVKLESGLYDDAQFQEFGSWDHRADGRGPTDAQPGEGVYDYSRLSNPEVLARVAELFIRNLMWLVQALARSPYEKPRNLEDLRAIGRFYDYITSDRCPSQAFRTAAAGLSDRLNIPTVREFARKKNDDLSMAADDADSSELGRPQEVSFESQAIDREQLALRVNTDVWALRVVHDDSPDSERWWRVEVNPEFFESTISPRLIERYRSALQALVDRDRGIGSELFRRRNENLFDYFALSDLALDVIHRVYKKTEDQRSAEFIEAYVVSMLRGEQDPRYRRFRLAQAQAEEPDARQVLLSTARPERVVLTSEASPEDLRNPNVMVVENAYYQMRAWRENPRRPGTLLPGEKILIARWRGRVFMFYTSRSHTVAGIQAHQWRSCDLFWRGQGFAKSNPENLDEVRGVLNVWLDGALYSGEMVERSSEQFYSNVGKINEMLLMQPETVHLAMDDAQKASGEITLPVHRGRTAGPRDAGDEIVLPRVISSQDVARDRMRDINRRHRSIHRDPAQPRVEGQRIVIPETLLPDLYGDQLQRELRARDVQDIEIVPEGEAIAHANDNTYGPETIILLTPELARRINEGRQVQQIVLGTDDADHYNFVFLEGGVALARAIFANDRPSVAYLYGRLSGGESIDTDAVMEAFAAGRLRLNVLLPAILIPTNQLEELQRQAYILLRSA